MTTESSWAASISKLSLEEEIALGERIRQGDLEARNLMIESNLALTTQLARKYARWGFGEVEDLAAHGVLGLLHATESYDPRKKLRFANHAYWPVRSKICELWTSSQDAVDVSKNARIEIRKVWQAMDDYDAAFKETPTPVDIARMTGFAPTKVRGIIGEAPTHPVSIDETITADSFTTWRELAGKRRIMQPEHIVLALEYYQEAMTQVNDVAAYVLRISDRNDYELFLVSVGLDGSRTLKSHGVLAQKTGKSQNVSRTTLATIWRRIYLDKLISQDDFLSTLSRVYRLEQFLRSELG